MFRYAHRNPTRLKKKKKKRLISATPAESTPSAAVILPVAPASPAPQTPRGHQQPTPAPSSSKEKKALKKRKGKEKKDDRDEVDKALEELSLKYPDLQQVVAFNGTTSATRDATSTLALLLSVSLQHLDSEAEMRKFFGAKVISAAKSSNRVPSTSNRTPAIKSNLTRPQPTWWPARFREGLSSRLLTEEENAAMLARHHWKELPGERFWTVEYSKKYRGFTWRFMQTVMSGDPNGFNAVLREFPYHADTLLQMSEVLYHREEYSEAADLIDRALFTYERAFIGSFSFTTGMNRLDFDRVENRPFFLAIHRQINDLQRRGCVRTAFEFARLLYSLDPWTDPHGAVLYLDYLAMKAGMGQWLLDLWEFFTSQAGAGILQNRLQATAVPGWSYARALALWMRENDKGEGHEPSTQALQDAILAFPSVVPLLADKADIFISADARQRPAFRIHADASHLNATGAIVHLLSHLYAQRSASLWKAVPIASWFAATVSSTLSSLPASHDNTTALYRAFAALAAQPAIVHSIYRHVIVLEASFRGLFSFVPREVLQARSVACDPLPPPTSVSAYDTEYFKGAADALRPSRRQEERALERLVPDALIRGQLLDFFRERPGIAAQFPGGILQFLQEVAQNPNIMEELVLDEIHQDMRDAGAMPGMFFEEADDEPDLAIHAEEQQQAEDREEEEEDDEDEEPAAVSCVHACCIHFAHDSTNGTGLTCAHAAELREQDQ
ncbi:DUF654-domain-containing protein [Laetiporus sulphureus 93-53]|uniref:DUF654-domain-containing protein n=1 Tax=Laetiporus sulphureus 93-53 TaxID=1314785 RepID=A0A165IL01_9APHY|nr:DUF654-domain-containing protein [Laetiporus sulphureus 93-53]KZT13227.1 DUF654-domain-containing protein [Laetiporus sulphureus 93-53]